MMATVVAAALRVQRSRWLGPHRLRIWRAQRLREGPFCLLRSPLLQRLQLRLQLQLEQQIPPLTPAPRLLRFPP
eukprot:834368-Alexandrium_andersonii.AAC.1